MKFKFLLPAFVLAAVASFTSYVGAQVTITPPGSGVSLSTANTWTATQTFNNITITGTCTGCTASGTVSFTGSAPVDTAIARYSGTSGNLIQASAPLISSDGRITTLTDPTGLQDSSTKNYVDTQISNLNIGGASQNSFLVNGGQITWSSALTFTASSASYYLNGTLTTSTQQNITLAAADPTNPRIDLIGLDSTGTIQKITGTAASTPSVPSYDPSAFLPLTSVSVPASATTPPGVVNTLVYQSDTGGPGEWNWSVNGSGIVVNSTNNPLSPGTHTIEATAMANGASATGQIPSSTLDPNGQNFFIFYIQSKATWPKNRTLTISFLNAGVQKGSQITLQTGAYGFNSANTTSYQQIAIPVSQIGITQGTTITQVKFTDAGGAIGFYIGLVEFQTGLQGVNNQGITQAQADARYRLLSVALNLGTATDITGNLGVTHLNSGTGASSSTFWRGDGTWASAGATPGGSPNDIQCNVSSALGACSTGVLTFSSSTLFVNTAKSNTNSALALAASAPAGGTSGAAGNNLTLNASNATTGSGAGAVAGGAVTITAGNAAGQTSGSANGGGITITSGNASAFTNPSSGNGGTIALQGGNGANANSGSAVGGAITLTGGTEFTGGPITITGGSSTATASSQGGAITIAGGNTGAPSSGNGGNVTIKGGGGFQGGTVTITTAHTFQNQTLAISIVPDVDAQGLNCSPCDNGGKVSIAGGPGQPGNAFSGSSTGGIGGSLTLAGGAGGNVAGGPSPAATGGAGGNLILASGAGGTGNPTAGTAGDVVIQGAVTERMRILGASALVRIVASTLTATGTGPTLTGCSFTSQAGGLAGGKFASGTTGTCSVAISGLPTVATGYLCLAQNITHPVIFTQTATSTTGCTISATTTSGDLVAWWAFGY